MKLLKVLNKDLKSPYQDFQFKIGKKYHCEDFDESNKDCSRGYYTTDIDGLPYAYNIHRKVFECEVWGKSKEFGIYKRRYENFELIREVTREELVEMAKPRDLILGYKLSEIINPINPLLIKRGEVKQRNQITKTVGFCRGFCQGFCRDFYRGFCQGFCRGFCQGFCRGFCRGFCLGFYLGFCRGFYLGI